MITIENLFDNPNILETARMENVRVFEYQKDLSLAPSEAMHAYYASKMNVNKRQVLIELDNSNFTISAGAMHWTAGSITMKADVKGVGDLFGKLVGGAVSKESPIKPRYEGTGLLMLEPTYKYILLEKIENWGTMVLEDGLFLGCQSQVEQKIVSRSNFSSAALGGEGFFNLSLKGQGVAILESPVPREELLTINLENDELRVDGNFAIAWSGGLDFRVEKSSKSFMGSAVSGEGFVNVYRGTGKVLMAPVM